LEGRKTPDWPERTSSNAGLRAQHEPATKWRDIQSYVDIINEERFENS